MLLQIGKVSFLFIFPYGNWQCDFSSLSPPDCIQSLPLCAAPIILSFLDHITCLSFFIWILNVKNTISDISKHLSFQLYWRCNSSRWVCWLDKLVWAKMKYVHCYQSFLCQVQSQKKAVDLLSGLAYHVDLKTVKSYILIIITTLIHQRLSHRITRHFLLLKWGVFQFCNSVILFIFFC